MSKSTFVLWIVFFICSLYFFIVCRCYYLHTLPLLLLLLLLLLPQYHRHTPTCRCYRYTPRAATAAAPTLLQVEDHPV